MPTKITDGSGSGFIARVSQYGVLATGSLEFSTAYPITASAINTGYNFVPPIADHQFVVTSILLYANKNVGVNDATVEIYEADAVDSTTISKSVLSTEMVKQTSRDLTSLNLIVSKGKWLNLKTDDATIFASVLGYYVPVA
jgi:hypothetical protein